jgi:hypothetical protein
LSREYYVKKVLVAGSLALVSVNALADENEGFYLGAGFGQAQYDISQDELDLVALGAFAANGVFVLDSNSSLDDTDSAWSVSAGYQISRYFAVEVGYLDLGSAQYRATSPAFVPGIGRVNAAVGLDFSSKGPTVTGIAALPLGDKFDLHGHLGTFFSDTTIDIRVELDDVGESNPLSGHSQDLFAGVGAGLHLTKNFSLSLDYSLFKDVGGDDTGEGDISSLRLGMQYRY